jgi:putative transposase
MPFEERTAVDIREEMALLALDERYSVMEVAELFGVTPPTVRLWRDRYREFGRTGLSDRSHAPAHCPHRTAAAIEQWIVADRARWGFGSKKILERLKEQHPNVVLPKRSTIDSILVRRGFVRRSKRRRAKPATAFAHRYVASEPGELTTIDYKGEFRLHNGRYCYPLTMVDRISRYLLACEALDSTSFERAWPVIERVFRQHGLPRAMQSDNGPPFGATHGKFSRMSVMLMSLDIQPVFGRPGRPQDNGAHERMHRELKAETAVMPARTFTGQQAVFDAFRNKYNVERPHEGIGMQRPARLYNGSPRSYPKRRSLPEYPTQWEKRKVLPGGEIKWKQAQIFISHALAGQTIGLEATDVDLWTVHFYRFQPGKLDQRDSRFI